KVINLLSLLTPRQLDRVSRDTSRSFLSDDLQALHHSGYHFVLNAGILALGVLAHDDQIDAWIAGRKSGQIHDRSHIRVQLELFAQRHVDAGESAADRRRYRSLEPDTGALERFD